MKNSIVKYDRVEQGDYSVTDYTSKSMSDINEYIVNLDDNYFDYYQMTNNDKLERIALELYGNPDYWDIILVLNSRNPLFDFALDYDTLANLTDTKVQKYNELLFDNLLSNLASAEMTEKYQEEYLENNEIYRVLKIVKPSRMYEFLQGGYEQGYF